MRYQRSGWLAAVFVLVLCSVSMSWMSAVGDAQTSDEAVHLAAGYSYLATGDYRMNTEHPPLMKMICAVPLLFYDLDAQTEGQAWKKGWEWAYGTRFLYRNHLPFERTLLLGRAPVLLIWALTLLLVVRWAQTLYGPAGGLIALVIAAFEPNMLAHSHYVTNDLGLAFFYAASLYALTRYRENESRARLLAVGVLVGLTLGCKYSGVILLPLLPVFLWPHRSRASRAASARATFLRLTAVGMMSYCVLWLIYRGEPIASYWAGYSSMQSSWNGFLLGEVSSTGWFHYFLVAFLVKTAPGTLLLFALAIASIRRFPLVRGEGVLLIGALCFFVVSSALRINIGIRHILPVYVLLIVLVGRCWLVLRESEFKRVGVGIVTFLALWTVVEVSMVNPFYVSYFSSFVGGPWEGYRYLGDSNLDWGQDVGRLAEWVHEEKVSGLLMGVFTNARPEEYGIREQPVPQFGTLPKDDVPLDPLPDKLYLALSALNLQGVYLEEGAGSTRFPIKRDIYQFLLEYAPARRLTPSIWIWEIGGEAEILYRLGAIYLNFGWNRCAVSILERYVRLRPEDEQARKGLERLKAAQASESEE